MAGMDKVVDWGVATFRKANTPRGSVDLAQQVVTAYDLLCNANQRGIQIPAEVVSVVIQARRADNVASISPELETRFWNAYGLLSSSIEPAERARSTYKRVFYVTLAALLFGQLFFMGVESVRARLTKAEEDLARLASVSSDKQAVLPSASSLRTSDTIAAEQVAYLNLGRDLLQTADAVSSPLHFLGMKTIFNPPEGNSAADKVLIRGKIEMLSLYLGGYLLPMLYGLLGACAFVLRKLSDEIEKLTYANDARVRYSLRLNIGLLSGLAVGWFIKPTATDGIFSSLSPVALAFIAGYGSELFFVFLDKIVQAFGGASNATSTSIREVTSGAITTTTVNHRETHIAGANPDDPKNAAPVSVAGAGETKPTPSVAPKSASPGRPATAHQATAHPPATHNGDAKIKAAEEPPP